MKTSNFSKTSLWNTSFIRGVHRANRYNLNFKFPPNITKKMGLPYAPQAYAKALNEMCTNCTIPTGSISTNPHRIMGEVYEMPYERNYAEATFTFYFDNDGMAYSIINAWLGMVFNPKTKRYGYPDEYWGEIEVELIKTELSNGKLTDYVASKTTLQSAFPKAVTPINLTGMSGSQPTQFDVTFSFRNSYTVGLHDEMSNFIPQ